MLNNLIVPGCVLLILTGILCILKGWDWWITPELLGREPKKVTSYPVQFLYWIGAYTLVAVPYLYILLVYR